MENDKTARPSRRRTAGGRPPATRRLVAGGGQDGPIRDTEGGRA
ncbi:hypothetical protein [Streptomyces rugosispiralis]|uniref:Uncharacterized protein n=1 Tax=Streptomyces rugosispiralis TaxID=2967341 RepID=A0ABT1UP10_9ACTN|nr:hypothetical protein [Streptomyces rugosispiralis]MCQ8186874.1 hypothetical protein [Streptomyces rugosispiralis]